MYCNTTLAKPPAIAIQISATTHSCNTILLHCSVLQYNFFQPLHTLAIQFQQPSPLAIHLILQYNFPANYTKVAIQFPSCNTTFHSSPSLAIQNQANTLPRLEYNFPIAIHLGSTALPQILSHNTKLSITIQFRQWPKTVSALLEQNFFFFHLILEKHLKIYTYIFFFPFFLEHQINL